MKKITLLSSIVNSSAFTFSLNGTDNQKSVEVSFTFIYNSLVIDTTIDNQIDRRRFHLPKECVSLPSFHPENVSDFEFKLPFKTIDNSIISLHIKPNNLSQIEWNVTSNNDVQVLSDLITLESFYSVF